MNTETTTGLAKVEIVRIEDGRPAIAAVEYVPAERVFTLRVNNQIETRLHCAPHRIKALVLGWLVAEGVIDRDEEFVAVDTDLANFLLRVTISEAAFARLAARTVDAPFGRLGEAPFERRVDTLLELKPEQITRLAAAFKKLFLGLKSNERMCYLAAFAQGDEILSYGEGFHRVNALYRALGELLAARVTHTGRIALTNFGLTRELVLKLARAGVNLAITAAAPSNAAIEAANDYYLSIVTNTIGGQLTVYSAPWRVN